MLKFFETKIQKEKFYAVKKLGILMLIIQLSQKLVKKQTNSNYLIGYLDKAIRSLVLIMLKMSGYVRHLKLKMEEKMKTIKFLRSYY